METEYDPVKDVLNQRKHGVSLALAESFDWDTAQIEEDVRYDYGEQRFKATGLIGGIVHVVIYCDREDITRIISLRKADRKEAKHYASYHATYIDAPHPYSH